MPPLIGRVDAAEARVESHGHEVLGGFLLPGGAVEEAGQEAAIGELGWNKDRHGELLGDGPEAG